MAEAIGLVSSVIAVLQLAQAVTAAAYRYTRSVKNAPKDTRQLATELTSLVGTLNAVRDVAQDDPDGLSSIAGTGGPLDICTDILQRIQTKLIAKPKYAKIEKLNGEKSTYEKSGELLKRLLWPFKEEETREMLSRLERAKGVLLLSLTADQSVVTKEVRKLSEETNAAARETLYLVNKIQDTQDARDKDTAAEKNDEKRLEVIRWLFDGVDHTTNQVAASKLRQEGTGEWFLEKQEFQSWLNDKQSPNLWLHGIPGAGKTVLLSTAISATTSHFSHSNVAVIYFYFSFSDSKKQSPTLLLSSLAAQLCQLRPDLHASALSLYEEHRKNGLNSRPSASELISLLRELSSTFPNVFILVDALDECTSREGLDGLLDVIKRLSNSKIRARFLFTSRKEMDIEVVLNDLQYKAISIRSDSVKHDVRIYAAEVVENSFGRKLRTDIRREIVSALVEGAHGMFRWVACQIDALKKCRTPKAIREALKTLPETLDSTYDRILHEIESRGPSDAELARRALLWLVHTKRPLRTGELAEAIIVELSSTCLDEDLRLGDPADPEYENFVGNTILEVCGSLVRVQEEDEFVRNIRSVFNKIASRSNSDDLAERDTSESSGMADSFEEESFGIRATGASGPRVRFRSPSITSDPDLSEKPPSASTLKIVLSHYSVKEYLTSPRIQNSYFSLHDEEASHAEILNTCLTYLQWSDFSVSSKRMIIVPDSRRYWGLRSSSHAPSDSKLIEQLYPLYHYAANHWMNHVTSPSTNDLSDFQKILLAPSPTQQFECWTKCCAFLRGPPTPLYCLAIWGFHAALVYHIDVLNADPNALNGVYKFPLQAAARFDRVECVSALLKRGARVNATDWSSFTALHHAVLRHRDGDKSESKTVALLLDHSADVGILSTHERLGPLHMAVQRRLPGVVRQMLSVATIKDIMPGDDNILHFAVRISSGGGMCAETIGEILKRYPDLVYAVDPEDGKTALHAASAHARFKGVEVLRKAGAAIAAEVGDGVDVLLKHRTQLYGNEAKRERALTAQEDLERRACEVMEVLIRYGADTNARDAHGRSCYRYALLGGTEDDAANSKLTETVLSLLTREQLKHL